MSRWAWSWAPVVLMSTRPATWRLAFWVPKVTGTRPTRSTRYATRWSFSLITLGMETRTVCRPSWKPSPMLATAAS